MRAFADTRKPAPRARSK